MKNWTGQLFPITLLGLIAALTFWLDATLAPGGNAGEKRLTHDPDAIAEDFEIRRLDESGRVKYRLNAPYMQHFPDDDSSEIRAPRLVAYRQDAAPVTMTAEQALVTARGEQVTLNRQVEIIRAASADKAELLARTPALTVLPDAGTAHTEQPVEISQGASQVTGIGARIDNNASTFELLAQVRGRYVASKAQP